MKLSLLASALLQQTSGQGLGLVASGPTSRVSTFLYLQPKTTVRITGPTTSNDLHSNSAHWISLRVLSKNFLLPIGPVKFLQIYKTLNQFGGSL